MSVMKEKLHEFFMLNDNEYVSSSTLWCAHKAYIRGLLFQLASRGEKRKAITMDNFMREIKTLEKDHKKQPNDPHLLYQPNICRTELRAALGANHDRHKLKLNFYSQDNRAGKLLTSKLQEK